MKIWTLIVSGMVSAPLLQGAEDGNKIDIKILPAIVCV